MKKDFAKFKNFQVSIISFPSLAFARLIAYAQIDVANALKEETEPLENEIKQCVSSSSPSFSFYHFTSA